MVTYHDINGDGLHDYVESDGENNILVRRNLTGRTNMLRSVTFRFGGHINIDYKQTKPSYEMPGRRWVMASVETTGGYKNVDSSIQHISQYRLSYKNIC